MWFLSQLFTEGLLQKPPSSSDLLSLIGSRQCSHAAVNSDCDVRSIQIISLLKIFEYEYTTKQACKQLQCNRAELSEPASINGLHIGYIGP